MQIKIFSISVTGGEVLQDELNLFLRTKRILQTEKQLVVLNSSAFWCFCISYIENDEKNNFGSKEKTDYRKVLDEAAFLRFSALREIRKLVATEEGIFAYNVFTDAELAEIAKFDTVTLSVLKSIKGIGEKKVEKYGARFINRQVTTKEI